MVDKCYIKRIQKQEEMNMMINNMGQMSIFGKEGFSTNYTSQNQTVANKDANVGKLQKNGTIFVGDMMTRQDEIAAKRVKADKDCIKEILSTFTNQMELDKQIEDQTAEVENLRGDIKAINDEIAKIDKAEQQWKEENGITDDSQEQKDLDLIRKQNKFLAGEGEALTEEENERLRNMGELTDYQKMALSNDGVREKYQDDINEMEKKIKGLNQSVTTQKLEELKHSPMLKTMKEVEKIQENLSKEIMGELKKDMIDHIDETQEEEEEKAEEVQEKKEEEEEKTESKKQEEEVVNPEIQKVIIEKKSDIEEELKNIMNRLPSEDLKGISVDVGV